MSRMPLNPVERLAAMAHENPAQKRQHPVCRKQTVVVSLVSESAVACNLMRAPMRLPAPWSNDAP